jgi:hypothetical protein
LLFRSEKATFMDGEACKKIPAYNLISTDRHVCAGGPDGVYKCLVL